MAIVSGGINAAARALGLKAGSVRQRCRREGWMEDADFKQALSTGRSERQLPATLPAAVSPVQATIAEMKDLGSKSRIKVARGLHKAASHIESMSGPAIVANAGDVKQTVQSMDIVHGWKDQTPGFKIALSVTGQHVIESHEHATIEAIEAEWSDAPETDKE